MYNFKLPEETDKEIVRENLTLVSKIMMKIHQFIQEEDFHGLKMAPSFDQIEDNGEGSISRAKDQLPRTGCAPSASCGKRWCFLNFENSSPTQAKEEPCGFTGNLLS